MAYYRTHRRPRHFEKQEYLSRKMVMQRRLKQVLIAVLLLIVIWLVIAGDMGLWSMWQSIRYERKLVKMVEAEERRSRELDETIRKLNSDTLFIEQFAREKLGMVRDNEKVFIFVGERDDRRYGGVR